MDNLVRTFRYRLMLGSLLTFVLIAALSIVLPASAMGFNAAELSQQKKHVYSVNSHAAAAEYEALTERLRMINENGIATVESEVESSDFNDVVISDTASMQIQFRGVSLLLQATPFRSNRYQLFLSRAPPTISI